MDEQTKGYQPTEEEHNAEFNRMLEALQNDEKINPGKTILKIRRTYIDPLGTVTACIDCGALISGGVTRCVYCVDRKFPDSRWRRMKKRFRWLFGSIVGWG